MGLGAWRPHRRGGYFVQVGNFTRLYWGITFGLLILLARGIPQAFSTSLGCRRRGKGLSGPARNSYSERPAYSAVEELRAGCRTFLSLLRRGAAICAGKDFPAFRSCGDSPGESEILEWGCAVCAHCRFCSLCRSGGYDQAESDGRGFYISSSFLCRCFDPNLLGRPGLYCRVHDIDPQGGAAGPQVSALDRCRYDAFCLRVALHFFRHPTPGQSLRHRRSAQRRDRAHQHFSRLPAGPTRQFFCVSLYRFCPLLQWSDRPAARTLASSGGNTPCRVWARRPRRWTQ
jgi:hypothetical protein